MRNRKLIYAAAALVLIVVALFAGYRAFNEPRQPSAVVVMPSDTLTPFTPTPSPTPVKPPLPMEPVQMSSARAIAVPGIGYSAKARYLRAEGMDVDPLDYDSNWGVLDHGSLPGAPADNTVYMYCHTARISEVKAADQAEADQMVPCRLFQRAYENGNLIGQNIVLTTDAGILSYRIDDVLEDLTPDEYTYSDTVREIVPGRLIITMCMYYDDGSYSDHKFAVIASLFASRDVPHAAEVPAEPSAQPS